ncbi:MAG TPA: CBS domain-containing protein [Nitrososphaera sp.]|nr:CBS domain-containing protein [Nitrososphaera sp.]
MTTDGYYDQYKDKSIMTQETIATGLFKRVGDVAEPVFVALPEDMLVGEAVKIMHDKDVSSILVLEHIGSKSKSNNSNRRLESVISPLYLSSRKEQLVGILTERDNTLSCDDGK